MPDEFPELSPHVVEHHDDFYLWNEVVYLFVAYCCQKSTCFDNFMAQQVVARASHEGAGVP
jgi:hypothetical protein